MTHQHSYRGPGQHNLTHIDSLQSNPKLNKTVIQSHTAASLSYMAGQSLTREASLKSYTQCFTSSVLKTAFPPTHNRPSNPTLSHNLTLGLSQHPHLRPPGPSAGLQLQQVTPFLPFLCFSFLLFPLRNLVPVRKPKPFPAQGPEPGKSSQMTDKAPTRPPPHPGPL